MKTQLEAADTMLAASTLKTQAIDNPNMHDEIFINREYPQDLPTIFWEK